MNQEIYELADTLRHKFPELGFEVIDFAESKSEFYIAVVSSGPDYAPELGAELPPGWKFRGWTNPDQRNNIGVVVRSRLP